VNIVYNRSGERNTISRRVASPMWAQLNGAATERKRILSALTNTSTQASERVDNYISLFRATHLFSQEQQELTKNFHADCELSTAIVSRMLAVEDYVTAKAKVDEVRNLLSDAIAKSDDVVATVTQEIAVDNQQLESLKAAAAELRSPSAIQAEIAEIAARMAREGLSGGGGAGNIDALRAQRAVVEGAIGRNQAALERLGSLVVPVSEMPELLSTQRSVEQQLAEKQGELTGKQEQVHLASQEFDASRQAFAVVEREVAQVRKAVEDHTWFSASFPIYRDSDRAARQAEETLNRKLAALDVAQAEETRISGQIHDLESQAGPITELLNLKQVQHSRLELLLLVLPVQRRKSQRIRDIVAEEQRVQGALNRQNEEWTAAQSELASEVARADGLAANLTRLSGDQKRLVGLLDEVEGYIEDGVCPVCGDDHGSRDALIRKIKLLRAIDRSADLANVLSECRAGIERLHDRLNEMERTRSSSTSQLRTLAEERTKLEAELQSYATRANEFAVDPLSASGEQSARQLFARMAEEARDLRDRLDSATRAMNEAQALRVTAAAAVKDAQAAVASRRQVKAAAEAVIQRLRTDDRWNQALAAVPDMALQREAAARAVQLDAATTALSERRETRDKIQVELEGLRRQAANANAEIARLRTQLANGKGPIYLLDLAGKMG
jgi:exonuclease SbcC